MASTTSQVYPVALRMMASGTLDLNAQALKAVLLMANSTAGDAGATGIGSETVSGIGTLGECDATGFNGGHGNAGRLNIATGGMTITDDNATMTFDETTDLTWTAVAADASGLIAAVLIIRPGTSDDTDAIPIAYLNVGDTPANGGNIVIAYDALGIFTMTN